MAVVRETNLFRNGVLLEALATTNKETGLETNADEIKYLIMSPDQLWRDIFCQLRLLLHLNQCLLQMKLDSNDLV
jgi:hypothetical protein